MVKEKKSAKTHLHEQKPDIKPAGRFSFIAYFLYLILFLTFLAIILAFGGYYYFENNFKGKIYPGVRVDKISYGGKTPNEVEDYYNQKNLPFALLKFTLVFEDKIATISGRNLNIAYDAKLSATQAYSIGRSGHIFSNLYQKWKGATIGINLTSVLRMDTELIDDTVSSMATSIDIPAEDALFQFEKGKVAVFKISKPGRQLDQKQTKQLIASYIDTLNNQTQFEPQNITIDLPVKTVRPQITTEDSNNFGVKELLGVGTSKYAGSIPGRVHNIVLAASRINGHLIPPGEIFSFNDTLGDVSGSTGFQPAYIIKDGRTVLGDGGGVCQVSTTLFRAILNAGLPITERHAHSYRVSYYEQGTPPGIDATVFAPSYDLKFKNDTQNYILIQAKPDPGNFALAFEMYGTNDGRKAEISKSAITSQTPPPPDLFQDDPTLQTGVVKQVDWKAWGAKVNFDYKVTRDGETLIQTTYYSNYQPWQAVFLRGTKT